MCISNLHITRCFAYPRVKINRIIKAGILQFTIYVLTTVSSFFVRKVIMTKRSKGAWDCFQNYWFSTEDLLSIEQTELLGSIVVSIPACHAGDRGSIPRRGDITYFLQVVRRIPIFIWFKTLCGIHGKTNLKSLRCACENGNRNNPTSVVRGSKFNQLCLIV